MSAVEPSLSTVLDDRARLQPDAPAFTFVDYDVTGPGSAQTLTWSEIHGRAQIVAAELLSCGSPGDRVAILAPQSLEYIAAFLGAVAAGMIAVPLPVPLAGAHDDRVAAALKDCAPAVILTTSAVVVDVDSCVRGVAGPAPAVIEVDALDLYAKPARHAGTAAWPGKIALLQYTSGSTRAPAGVVVTHHNVLTNVGQVFADYFPESGNAPTPSTTFVSWLPFYHDMGLLLGIFAPLVSGCHAVITSPMAFLQKPARWMQLLAGSTQPMTAAPNFAFDLAARRTSDEDMTGLDLGHVHVMINGSERVHPMTVRRFIERFSRLNLPESATRPSYGLAEATLYVMSSDPGRAPVLARFDYEKLSAGHAERCAGPGSELVGHGTPRACTVRIVDPQSGLEQPAGEVDEIWVHGDNVAGGYWRNPQLSEETFHGRITTPSPGTPAGPWLRTGDLGVVVDGEMFIVGRIKDVLIVDGRNHYPDDIEATVQQITGGRTVAVSVPGERGERLVVIAELKQRAGALPIGDTLHTVRQQVAAAVSKLHGVRITDLVAVSPGAIPITTSGKVRRSTCADRYRLDQFTRLDTPA